MENALPNLHRYSAYRANFISVNRIIELGYGSAEEGKVGWREGLGGLLRYYYRDAA